MRDLDLFRGLTAAASLKRLPLRKFGKRTTRSLPRPHRRGLIEAMNCDAPISRAEELFRGLTAAASLKRVGTAHDVIRPAFLFRGLTAAASLKLLRRGEGTRGKGGLFRGLTAAASLKHFQPSEHCTLDAASLPRPHRRGLIAASHLIPVLTEEKSLFRGLTAAASLKRDRARAVVGQMIGSPRSPCAP